MRLSRSALAVLAVALLGPALLVAQEQPLAAGTEGVPVPKKKKHVQPVYPEEALAQGIRGIVILDLIIDTEGRVAETSIIRSIPGLDEAALVAASQWTYAPVKVDGKPVSVRLTVPITFALKLPEMSRQPGIPQLRQGVTPPWPDSGSPGGGLAVADVTLEPDGRIGLARILEGEEPWSTALLQALRTWRFSAPPDDVTVSFKVSAEFMRGRKGADDGSVRLDLSSLREAAVFDDPGQPEPMTTAQLAPVPEPASEPVASSAPAPAPETAPDPAPEPDAAPAPEAAEAPPAAEPAAAPVAEAEAEVPAVQTAEATPAATAPAPPASAPPAAEAPAPGPDTAPEPAVPAGLALARPSGQPTAPPPGAPDPAAGAPAAPPPGVDPTAPPPIETLSVAPPPLPPENGISAIRGVDLEPGVPDLTRGRRPVSPPLARMAGAAGTVEVEFSVSAGGATSIQRASGPEILQPAATGAVESWIFRRTRADRAYLVAVFTYEDDLASAVVKPQEQQ
jgi:TonB family protein